MIVVTTMQLTTNVCDFDVDRQRAALRSNLAYSLTTAHSYPSERERKNSERIELQWVNIYGWKKNSLPKLFHCNENACLKIDWQKCIRPEISIKMDRTGISLGAGWQKTRSRMQQKSAAQIRPCALNGVDNNNNEEGPLKGRARNKKKASTNCTFFFCYCCILITMHEQNITMVWWWCIGLASMFTLHHDYYFGAIITT